MRVVRDSEPWGTMMRGQTTRDRRIFSDEALIERTHDSALGIEHRHLAHIRLFIGGEQRIHGVLCIQAGAHQVQTGVTIAQFDKGLRGNRSDARLRPGHQRPHRKPVGLHGDLPTHGCRLPTRGIDSRT